MGMVLGQSAFADATAFGGDHRERADCYHRCLGNSGDITAHPNMGFDNMYGKLRRQQINLVQTQVQYFSAKTYFTAI